MQIHWNGLFPSLGTSVCWKKSLASRMKFPITTREGSAQHKAAVAWQTESQCPCRCSWVMQKHSIPHANLTSQWPAVWLAHVKLWCVLLFLVLIKKNIENYPSCSSCIMKKMCVCWVFRGGEETCLFTDWKAISQVGLRHRQSDKPLRKRGFALN